MENDEPEIRYCDYCKKWTVIREDVRATTGLLWGRWRCKNHGVRGCKSIMEWKIIIETE